MRKQGVEKRWLHEEAARLAKLLAFLLDMFLLRLLVCNHEGIRTRGRPACGCAHRHASIAVRLTPSRLATLLLLLLVNVLALEIDIVEVVRSTPS